MRVSKIILIGTALLLGSATHIYAREYVGDGPKSNKHDVESKAAGCSPAQSIQEFYINNVRTAAETAGNTWYDRANGNPYYEVPAGEGNHAIFAGALWMGGEDPAGNLKLAGVRFRQIGNDYWPGPLTVDGAASVTPETCMKWDRFFRVSKQMVEKHRYYFTLLFQGIDPSTDPLFENEPYVIPDEILNWPAHGDVSLGQSPNIAPFADLRDPITGDIITSPGLYEPEQGDYPLYDLEQEIDCRTRLVTDPVPLFGDFTMYWVMNDKGNVHSESGGAPIGMEIQAQMFGFTTNDEINNMTFCNYVLINRGSLTLQDTYFAQWVDTDLGDPTDDYVGCDVGRGLGYSYNGDNFDGSSSSGPGYGAQPPAIGVDFFEGPYQDADGINNKVGIGFNEALNGLGYHDPNAAEPDSVIDNERYGMRRFLFYNNSGDPAIGEPSIAIHYYNLMRGIWKNGARMTFGGNGYNPGDPTAIPADFMFPGDSDPLHWGTQGVDPNYGNPGGWTEENENNAAADRRFLQSAGPFTLQPGQFNNITVGVVYARAATGGPFASVKALLQADDKSQALFENCFRLLNGPDAPDLSAQELDKKVILYLRNVNALSNNKGEAYEELDPTIPPFDTAGVANDQYYRFQGYQVFQLKNSEVSIAEIDDLSKARLVFQADIIDYDNFGNPIGQIINYEFDSELGLPVPVEKVNGTNEGIKHSFQITNDQFASGDTRLINFKKYYYIAIAYGYNNYEKYNPNPDDQTGQSRPYLRGRSGAAGDIQPITVIPHKPVPEKFGTVFVTEYGDGMPITRIEGAGNGRKNLELEQSSIDDIMDGSPWKADKLKYLPGAGPINVKIVDPLNVKAADFVLKFYNDKDAQGNYVGSFDNARWYMFDKNEPADTIWSETTIRTSNEQIVPEYGISVDIGQYNFEVVNTNAQRDKWKYYPALLGSGLTYPKGGDQWLGGVADRDGNTFFNWIRSGIVSVDPEATGPCFTLPTGEIDPSVFNDYLGKDDRQIFEDVAGGILSPAYVAASYDCGPAPFSSLVIGEVHKEYNLLAAEGGAGSVGSVEIYITPDKSKWTRAMVFEMQHENAFSQGNATKMQPRGALSVDKNGKNQLEAGANYDEATYNGQQLMTQAYLDQMTSGMTNDQKAELLARYKTVLPDIQSLNEVVGLSFGMGWFPGYAFDPSTGERLNISFAENSYFAADNGRDMLWNPSSRISPQLAQQFYFGGLHFVYVYRNQARIRPESSFEVPMYDGSQMIYDLYYNTLPNPALRVLRQNKVWRAMDWVYFPIATQEDPYLPVEDGLIPNEVRLFAHVGSPYKAYVTLADELGDASLPYVPVNEHLELSENNWYPMYEFNTLGIETKTYQTDAAINALDIIDIVPNPYYAYSTYEESRIENTVKFINLPPRVTIKIFTMNGTLIRVLDKDNPNTWLEWDLRNESFIPIAGGMYLIHVESPTLGERVLKFFAATRPADLRNF